MFRSRWISILAVSLFVIVPSRKASANCTNGQTTMTAAANDGNALYFAMKDASPPCTLTVPQGTYLAPSAPGLPGFFMINNGVTVRSSAGPNLTKLQAGTFAAVALWPVGLNTCPSGATLQGFTLESPGGGVFAGADPVNHPGCSGTNRIQNVTLRNLIINNVTPQSSGAGIHFNNVDSSVIDAVNVVKAYAPGILLGNGSDGNIVMNSLVQQSFIGIQVTSSNGNVIVGNTINGSAFNGITLDSQYGRQGPGSSYNRIERNYVLDGITLTDRSLFNYVGLNSAISPAGRGYGVGVWVNNASDGNYVYGNDAAFWGENGIDVLTSSNTFLEANSAHNNQHGGIWVANIHDATIDPSAPPPQNTVLQGNNTYFNASVGNINLQGAINSEVSYNYLSGVLSPHNGTLLSTQSVGVQLQASSGSKVFENTISEVNSRAFVFADDGSATFFRNRFVRGVNNPYGTNGLNGQTWSIPPSDTHWDGGPALGGNFWGEFTAPVSNPDPLHPYTAFLGNTNGAPYIDRFPYDTESLATAAIPNSVTVVEPVAGSVMAAGSTRTIHWVARGCTLVDLYYRSGVAGSTLIASGHPNVGFYFWTVPSLPIRSDYVVDVVCTNRDGAPLGTSGTSPQFGIAAGDLVLLNPGRATRAANSSVVRVAWKASAAVAGNIQIYMRSNSGGEVLVDTAPAGSSFRDITLPAGVSNSGRVLLRIQDSASSSRQDSVDGYFAVRGTSPSFASSPSGQSVNVGTVQYLEWQGHVSGDLIDLDLLVPGGSVAVARNLPDVGHYTALVPDVASTANAKLRATFRDAGGNAIWAIESGIFSIVRTAVTIPISKAMTRRDFDGDQKTDLAVYRPTNGTWYVLRSADGFSYGTQASYIWGEPGDIPINGEFDGDGRLDLAIWRPSTGDWWVALSSTGFAGYVVYRWGEPGDVPVAADFDGDGRTDLTIWRPSTGDWWIEYSSQNYSWASHAVFRWGEPGDIPLATDFDGDGRTDLAIWRPWTGDWWVEFSSQNYSWASHAVVRWGEPGDIPLATDFDRDGKTELTIWRPSTGDWWIEFSSTGYSWPSHVQFQWGLPGDIPYATDFDGDGQTDLTVWRPSIGGWFILYSSLGYNYANYSYVQWGLRGDTLAR